MPAVELRALSRTAEGRAEIMLHHVDGVLDRLESLLDCDTVAVLANLFSDDSANCALLDKVQARGDGGLLLLSKLAAELDSAASSPPPLFLSLSVCLGNAWAQTCRHRAALRKADVPGRLARLVGRHNQYSSLVVRGMIKMHSVEEEDEEEDWTRFTREDMQALLKAVVDDDEDTRRLVRELLLCSSSFARSASGDAELTAGMRAVLVSALSSSSDDALAYILRVCSNANESASAEQEVMLGGGGEVLAALKHMLTPTTSSVAVQTQVAKILATALDSAGLAGLIVPLMRAQGFSPCLLDVVQACTAHVPSQLAARALDQSQVLPFATLRVHCLTALSSYAARGGQPCALELLPAAAKQMAELCLAYWDYDYECTRVAVTVLKHASLADGVQLVQAVPGLTHLVSVLAKSQDHHTSFIACGVFRTVCCARDAAAACVRVLVEDKPALLTLLSLDLSKLHPHARVELARAFAQLMMMMKDNNNNGGVLATAQAVKFVSFLLASSSPDLQLECLRALANLPQSLLRALPRLEIEILPPKQMMLMDRVRELSRQPGTMAQEACGVILNASATAVVAGG